MGKHFLMSKRFDKCSAKDFGLEQVEGERCAAIDPKDGTVWAKVSLYDFGWGKENGYYKKPFLTFPQLYSLVLNNESGDDLYGAAAIILDHFPDELLAECEGIMNDHARKQEFRKLIEVFDLKNPANRCPIQGKSACQINSDYSRWKRVSDKAAKIG